MELYQSREIYDGYSSHFPVLCAVVVQVLVGILTGNLAYGAIAGCTFFIVHEHTQAEYR